MSGQQSFLEAYSPWSSRSTTPKLGTLGQTKGEKEDGNVLQPEKQSGKDHTVNYRHWFSARDYPKDCPKAAARWFYATDVGDQLFYVHTQTRHAVLIDQALCLIMRFIMP